MTWTPRRPTAGWLVDLALAIDVGQASPLAFGGRDGDRLGYPQATADTVRPLIGAERLCIGGDDLTGLATAWHTGHCDEAHQRLTAAVDARLRNVQDDLADQLGRRPCGCRESHPSWSGRMLVFMQDAAEAVASADVEIGDHGSIGD